MRVHICEKPGCEKPATVSTIWKTAIMAAPAFWYECEEHAQKTREHFQRERPTPMCSQKPINR